jgi:hypothetical protein
MNRNEFVSRMSHAEAIGGDYGRGYQRGLRRLYHGDRFGTEQEHETWLGLGTGDDPREELGRGYRDGFEGRPPKW